MEPISEILSAQSVLYAFIFIYAQILSDKITKFMDKEKPIVDGTEKKSYECSKRNLCVICFIYLGLNLAVILLALPIVMRIICNYDLSFSINAEILPVFGLCLFVFQIVNFIHGFFLLKEIL